MEYHKNFSQNGLYLYLFSDDLKKVSSLKRITVSFSFSKSFCFVYHTTKFGHAFTHLLLFGLFLGLVDLVILLQARKKRLCILKSFILFSLALASATLLQTINNRPCVLIKALLVKHST